MIRFQKFVGHARSLWSNTRGSSEAVSQALLFMVIISTAAGISIVGGDVLGEVQDEESINQAIISFESLDDTISKMTTLGSENEFTTASQSGAIRSINAELHQQEPTIISINSGGGYEIESRPLMVRNMDYEATYDSGIIQAETVEGIDTIRTPVDQSRLNTNILIFRSISYADDADFRAGNSQPLLISQQSAPETVILSPGDSVSVSTGYSQGWVEHFESHPRLDSVTVDSTSGESRSDVEAQVSASGDLVVQVTFVEIEPTSR